MSVLLRNGLLVFLLTMIFLFFSAPAVFACGGGGGGGGGGGDKFDDDQVSESNSPPPGFSETGYDVSSDASYAEGETSDADELTAQFMEEFGLDGEVTLSDPSTGSVGSSDTTGSVESSVEEEITQHALEQEEKEDAQTRQAAADEEREQERLERYNNYISKLPKKTRHNLTRRELIGYAQINELREKGVSEHVIRQALDRHNAQIARTRKKAEEQSERAREDANWIAKQMVSMQIHFLTGGSFFAGLAFNAATEGEKGAANSIATQAVTSRLPGGNAATRAAVSQVVSNVVGE